jgi:hypothetical protein
VLCAELCAPAAVAADVAVPPPLTASCCGCSSSDVLPLLRRITRNNCTIWPPTAPCSFATASDMIGYVHRARPPQSSLRHSCTSSSAADPSSPPTARTAPPTEAAQCVLQRHGMQRSKIERWHGVCFQASACDTFAVQVEDVIHTFAGAHLHTHTHTYT